MNRIQTLYWENGKPIELDKYLIENKKKLKNKLCFYMVSSVAEPDIIKFGITIRGDAYSRLNSYVISYGIRKRNKATGVMLLYLGFTNYNKNVYYINTRIYKTEKYLKQFFRKKNAIVRGRGSERVRSAAKSILQVINKKTEEIGDDEITIPRRSTRGKKIFEYETGDTVFLKWTSQDVKEYGGYEGIYQATINKIKKDAVDVTYEDGFEIIIPNDKFKKKIVTNIND